MRSQGYLNRLNMRYLILPILRVNYGVLYFLINSTLFLIYIFLYFIWYLKILNKDEIIDIFKINGYPGSNFFETWDFRGKDYTTSLHWIIGKS